MTNKTKLAKIKKITTDFFKKLSLEADFEISEEETAVKINLSSSESALLIGYHGETLRAIEYTLRQIVNKKLNEYTFLSLDINNYREREELKLRERARKVGRRVANSGRAEEMEVMNAGRRRLVHLEIKTIPGIESESIGEGMERRVLIKPKSRF